MSKTDNEFRKSAIAREKYWYDQATDVLEEQVKLFYEQSLEKIQKDIAALYARYATENGLSMTEARRLIRGNEYKVWRMTLEEYVKAAKTDSAILKELNTLAMRSRISRFEALHARTLMEIATLCDKLNQTEEALQYRAYIENFYGNLYDIHKNFGLVEASVIVSAAQVERALTTNWSGEHASKRILKNGSRLSVALKDTLMQAIHRGLSIQKLSKDLSRRMDIAYNYSKRLIQTELNFIQTRAAFDSIASAGLEYYQFVATLDNRTTPICRSLDGKIFSLDEKEQGLNAPPMHVRCRSTVCAAIGEDLPVKKTARTSKNPNRNNQRERVEDMTYSEWKKVYVDGNLLPLDKNTVDKLDDLPFGAPFASVH